MFILLAFPLKKQTSLIYSADPVKPWSTSSSSTTLFHWAKKQPCSLWKSVVCMEMWGFSLQNHRTSVNMHLCKCTSRIVPREHVPDTLRQKGTSVFMVSDSFLNSAIHRMSFYCLLHSMSFQQFSLLSCPLFLFALPTSAFYDCCSDHTKNLMIIASQGNQSHNTPIEMRALARGDIFWSRKRNQGGGAVSLINSKTPQLRECLT